MSFKYAVVLTGSIATGKSTSVKFFKKLGFCVIDADSIAHKMLNEQHKEIALIFGKSMVENGIVQRSKLGIVVFADKKKREVLESLLHPLIYSEIKKEADKLDKKKEPYLIDIPLFFEGKRYPIEKSIVVYCTKSQQVERLMQRNGYTKAEALQRISTQIDIDEKKAKATYLVDNTLDVISLELACENIAKIIKKDF